MPWCRVRRRSNGRCDDTPTRMALGAFMALVVLSVVIVV